MQLTSTAFQDGEEIPKIYTCQGKEINPPLEFHKIPEGCVSLALIVQDPDVPVYIRNDRVWDHWIVFNMPPSTKGLKENAKPPGFEGTNTSGMIGYQGPCPPDREHRYVFKLYALDCMLPLKEGATKSEVLRALQGHVLEEATLTGRYVKT